MLKCNFLIWFLALFRVFMRSLTLYHRLAMAFNQEDVMAVLQRTKRLATLELNSSYPSQRLQTPEDC